MATVRAILWRHKKNKKGHHPIYIRISDTEKTRYVSTGITIHPRYWNAKTGEVRRGHDDKDEIDNIVGSKLTTARKEQLRLKLEGEEATVDHLHRVIAPERTRRNDFFSFADSITSDLQRREQIYTYKRYKSILHKFRKFTGEPLPFSRLTTELLRKFETHLVEKYSNSTNTVATNLNALKTITRRAIAEGHLTSEKNPFMLFRIKRARTNREKLDWEDIHKLEGLDLAEGGMVWHARNYFIFSFYVAGIRFGDLCKLEWSNILRDDQGRPARLHYLMSKTGTRKAIMLLPQAKRILRYYVERSDACSRVFPLLDGYNTSTEARLVSAISSQNALVNKHLKVLAKQAEISKHLSFHIARHSFADIARRQGWDVYTISKALGHRSISKTEAYMAPSDDEGLDRQMEGFGETMS